MAYKDEVLLGQLLINKSLITGEQLDNALKEQRKSGGFLGNILIKLGYISQDELFPVLANSWVWSMSNLRINI